jgi:hypothetical protein
MSATCWRWPNCALSPTTRRRPSRWPSVRYRWNRSTPYRTLQLVVHHTDGDREYAYDRDPILGSSTDQILAAATEHKWTVIDMAADWATIHPDA